MNRYLKAIKLDLIIKAVRYSLGSILAVLVDIAVLWGLVNMSEISYLYAAALAFIFGCITKYLVSKHFVFEDNSANPEALTITLFLVVAALSLLINQVVLFVGVDLLSMHLLVAKIMSAGIVFISNFFLLGYFVFKDPDIHTVRSANLARNNKKEF